MAQLPAVEVVPDTRFEGSIDKGYRAVRWGPAGVMELGNLGVQSDGFTQVKAYAVNQSGMVAGWAARFDSGNGGSRAVRWDASGTPSELQQHSFNSLGSATSFARGINEAGTVVGQAHNLSPSSIVSNGTRAVRWDATTLAITELHNLGTSNTGFTSSDAWAINTAGTTVGEATKYVAGASKGARAVRWDASSSAVAELGHIGTDSSGVTDSHAVDINDSGVAIGFATRYVGGISKGDRAVRWDASGTTATELGTLSDDNSISFASRATGINSAGTVVGFSPKYVAGVYKGNLAVRWDASSTAAIELGTLGISSAGITGSSARAINDAGITVGLAADYDIAGTFIANRAVMWLESGEVIDLNTLIEPTPGLVNLSDTSDISDDNWVTALGTFDPDGTGPVGAYTRTFLIQVPEPGAFAFVGLCALALRRRMHRTQTR